MALIDRFSNAVGQASTAYMEGQSSVIGTVAGTNQNISTTMKVWTKSPDKSYSLVQGGGQDVVMILNGPQMMTYFPVKKQYMINPAPAVAAGTGSFWLGQGTHSAKAMEAMKNSIQGATLVGNETVNGQPAKHVRLQIAGVASDMWLSDTTTPLPLRQSASVNANGSVMKMDMSMKWTINQPIPDTTFEIKPPAGATNMMARRDAGTAPANAAAAGSGNPPPTSGSR